MSRTVLDASAVLEVLLGTGSAAAVSSRISPAAVTLHAPHLLGAEVTQVLRRYERSGALTEVRARLALDAFVDLDVERYEHEPLLDRAWQLRQNLTAYDALYVALAEALQAPLLTTDARIARSPGHRAAVEVVAPLRDGARTPSGSAPPGLAASPWPP